MSGLFVLDACALIALLRKEPGSEIVETAFKDALEKTVTLMMNKLKLLEVYYDTFRSYGKSTADTLLDKIDKLPIHIRSEHTNDVMKEAGRLKASYKISIADSIALAEASISGGSLMTSDHHEFNVVEQSEDIKIYWIR